MGIPCQILPALFYVGKFHNRLLRKKKLSSVLYIQEHVELSPYAVISQGWRLPEEKVGPAGKEQADNGQSLTSWVPGLLESGPQT